MLPLQCCLELLSILYAWMRVCAIHHTPPSYTIQPSHTPYNPITHHTTLSYTYNFPIQPPQYTIQNPSYYSSPHHVQDTTHLWQCKKVMHVNTDTQNTSHTLDLQCTKQLTTLMIVERLFQLLYQLCGCLLVMYVACMLHVCCVFCVGFVWMLYGACVDVHLWEDACADMHVCVWEQLGVAQGGRYPTHVCWNAQHTYDRHVCDAHMLCQTVTNHHHKPSMHRHLSITRKLGIVNLVARVDILHTHCFPPSINAHLMQATTCKCNIRHALTRRVT